MNDISNQISSQVNEYLQTTTDNITSSMTDFIFQWVVIPSIVFMVLVLVIYIFRAVRRYRIEKAIFEIRDLLKTQGAPAPEVHEAPASPKE